METPVNFWVQLLTVVVAIAFSAVMTFMLFKIVDTLVGMRVEMQR